MADVSPGSQPPTLANLGQLLVFGHIVTKRVIEVIGRFVLKLLLAFVIDLLNNEIQDQTR